MKKHLHEESERMPIVEKVDSVIKRKNDHLRDQEFHDNLK